MNCFSSVESCGGIIRKLEKRRREGRSRGRRLVKKGIHFSTLMALKGAQAIYAITTFNSK